MAITLVAVASGGSPDGNSVTTGTIDTTGANLIVLVAASYNPPTFSDNKGNSYTQVLTQYGGSWTTIAYCAAPIVGAGHSFSVPGSGLYPSLVAMAFSGAAASPLDQSTSGSGAGTTGQPGSITPTEANELVITSVVVDTPTTHSIGDGFTIAAQVSHVGFQHFGGAAAYLVQGAAAAVNPTWNLGASLNYAMAIASFKAGAPTGLTLDAAPGSVTVAGTAASLAVSLPATTGAHSLAGTAATFGLSLSVQPGAYAVAGTAATPRVQLPMEAGTYLLAGSAAALLVGAEPASLMAEAGAYAIGGQAAAVRVSLPIGAATYAWAGSTAGMRVRLPMAAGAYVVTGVSTLGGVDVTLTTSPGAYQLQGFGLLEPIVGNVTDTDLALAFFQSDRPSRPRFADGRDDPTEFTRATQRGMQGRPLRAPEGAS